MNSNAADHGQVRLVEQVELLEARIMLLEAHVENLMERVYELEGPQVGAQVGGVGAAPLDATGFEAEQRLREMETGP